MANIAVQQDPSFVYFAAATDVIIGITDGPFLGQASRMLLVIPPGATVNNNDATATGTTRKIILRSGANFVGSGHLRLLELYYGSPDGTNFFWVQPE